MLEMPFNCLTLLEDLNIKLRSENFAKKKQQNVQNFQLQVDDVDVDFDVRLREKFTVWKNPH